MIILSKIPNLVGLLYQVSMLIHKLNKLLIDYIQYDTERYMNCIIFQQVITNIQKKS